MKLKLRSGTKVNKVLRIQREIALALAAKMLGTSSYTG
jgi:hypothetical protein